MKSKNYLTAFVLFIAPLFMLQAQTYTLDISVWTGENKNVELSTLNKITFSGENMVLNYVGGNTENIGMDLIRKLIFKSGENDLQMPQAKPVVSVSPNPAGDYIQLNNLPEGNYRVVIYSITGAVVLHLPTFQANRSIDISSLQKGLYVVKANNHVLKFAKQ